MACDLLLPYVGRALSKTERAEARKHLDLCESCRGRFALEDDTLTQQGGVFAENFDRLLGLHRLSAREASDALGISPTSLSYWRTGKREPTTDSVRRICEFFEVPMWELLTSPTPDFLPILAHRERFEVVERRIHGKPAKDDPPPGELMRQVASLPPPPSVRPLVAVRDE